MTTQTLYAWRNPLSLDDRLDHTWVTNYLVPETAGQPSFNVPLTISNWFCWGEYHAQTTGQLNSAQADPDVASEISPANVPALPDGAKRYEPSSTMGAITYYGLDGVCHNVANQVLAATGSSPGSAITVAGCNGYALSTFFFTTYGLNVGLWSDLLSSAKIDPATLAGDEFLPFMTNAGLTEDEQAAVLDIRATAHAKIRALRADVVAGLVKNYYPKLVFAALEIFAELVTALGLSKFKAVFGDVSLKEAMWLMPEGFSD